MNGKWPILWTVGILLVMISFGINNTSLQAQPEDDVVLTVEYFEFVSCPFLMTWDGVSWNLENDLFSVGRGAQREYTDYLFLNNHVATQDDRYCFEIHEVSSEESWIDMLKLITIDHPSTVRAGIDSSGYAHTYSDPVTPLSAYDASGADVMNEITDRDEVGVHMYEADIVALDFTGVDITAGAKLVIRVDGFEGDLVGQPTGKVPAIAIQTLEAGSWITRHTFFPKEFWAEGVFDLQPFLGETQTVRLLSVSCDTGKYHVLDYVGLDTTEDVLSVNTLDPVSAILNEATDVAGVLSASDDVYVHTANSDVLTVCFNANLLSDDVRSFGFLSEGYYRRVGNTFFVQTWDGSDWITRSSFSSDGYYSLEQIDLSGYLPDPEGENKVRIENTIEEFEYSLANIDWISLVVGDAERYLVSAKEFDTRDIYASVKISDDVTWNGANKWATFRFNTEPNEVSNPDFELGTTGWVFYTNGKGRFSTISDPFNGHFAANVQIVQEGSNVQLYQQGLHLEPATQYRLHFAAKSSNGADMRVYLHKHEYPYTNYGLNQRAYLGTDWQSYTFEFATEQFSESVDDARLRFWLAPFDTAGQTYNIDYVILEKMGPGTPVVPPPVAQPPTPNREYCEFNTKNVVRNPGFENGTSEWDFYTDGNGFFTTALWPDAFYCLWGGQVAVNETGSNVQLYQTDIPLKARTEYQLKLVARSSQGGDVQLFIHKHTPPYTNYGLNGLVLNLTPEWQVFTVNFTTTRFDSPVDDARLRFWLAPFAGESEIYDFDGISLMTATDAADTVFSQFQDAVINLNSQVDGVVKDKKVKDNEPTKWNLISGYFIDDDDDNRLAGGYTGKKEKRFKQ